MEPFTAMAVGGAIMGGGSILGGIFGKKAADAQQRALNQMKAYAQQEYKALGSYSLQQSDEILRGFLQDREANIGQYGSQYESLISDFDRRYAAAQTAYSGGMRDMASVFQSGMMDLERQYQTGMETAYATAATGRENTIAAIRRATASSLGRATQMQQLTGLAGTTFGQSALSGMEQEGAMREGVVQEQYASQLSGIQQAMAGNLAAMGQRRVGGMTDIAREQIAGERQMALGRMSTIGGLQENMIQQMLSQRQQTTGVGTAMRESSLGRYIGMEQARIGSILGIQQQQAAQAGAGWSAAAGAMGGIASGLGGSLLMGGLLGSFGGAGGSTSAQTGGAFAFPAGPGATMNPYG